MSVVSDVLSWSESAPPMWVRDALRRIATQRELDDSDLEQLVQLCKKSHGLNDREVTAVPLAPAHLPTTSQAGAVSIISVTHVADVNALAPGETISFSKKGLTVVYGDNGAGKTGYARILKRACRARGSSEAILANALSEQAPGAPTAKVKIDLNGVETEHVWKDDTPCPHELGAVSVFDSSAAQVYVSDRTELRFRPFGLDVLDKLAVVCGKLKARLDQERAALEGQAHSWPPLPPNTEVARLLVGLTALTSVDEVNRLATLGREEELECGHLAEVLATAKAEDPATRAHDIRLKAARLARLAAEVRVIHSRLNGGAVSELARLRREAVESEEAVGQLARAFGESARLPGLGQPAWRQLWDAARAFSEGGAYPGQSFPNIADGTVCVLCQQDLGPMAKERLAKFAQFVQAEAQQTANRAAAALNETLTLLSALDPATTHHDARDDLAVLDPQLSSQVETLLNGAAACRHGLLRHDHGQSPLEVELPFAEIEHLRSTLEARAQELTRAALPAGREEAERRHAELEARRILHGIRPTVLAEIKRKAKLNAYASCVRDTDTRGLTRFSTELTKKYVTDVLVSAFDQELRALGFTALELELRAVGAERGNLFHQVQLRHATRAVLPKVVSEGEARCIGLAAVLAELRSAAHASGIVFDDPVSSLDHRWRSRVAARLVELAKERQVIVFTHELVFLHALIHTAEAANVPYAAQSVWRRPSTTGHVDPDLPWTALSTQKRLGWIKNEWQRAEKAFRVQGQKEYEPMAIHLYARLRQTWERAVEEVLLCRVVERFRPSVETSRLSELRDITASDYEAVEAGMTKCSRWEGGHDQALAANEPVPAPNELANDIAALEKWIKGVIDRRKQK